MQNLITSANHNLVTPKAHQENPKKTGSVMSSFPMDMQIPGGRHDNDLAEISQVQILPTHGEIVSGNSEYLPSTNFLQPQFLADPLQRYIDSTFRLLRHDIFGSAKDVLRDLLQQKDLTRVPYLSGKDSGAHLYLGAQAQQMFINERNELQATVSFSTPPPLRKKTFNEQCRCFTARSSPVFWSTSHGLIPATFVPILKNLQRIQREGELEFQKWVLPGRKDDEDGHSIPPPTYARKPGFIFPLTSITNVGAANVALDLSTPESIDILKLQSRTGLDHGQCHGLIAALAREYALIQGPPGTEKSYLGVKLVQALLEIKEKAKLGPIIVICYTNHALDQFLKHLLDVGIQKIIRIGGRSQATELEGKNLRVVSKDIRKTRVESQTLGMSFRSGPLFGSTISQGRCMHQDAAFAWPVI
ncbi:hypothetical protein N7471_010473 [Penicillium samsonianum]|uniref:uncharacterized protein n=1 Tax=Penicillium samsonianum TaxID=1882272 RepID=UPI002546B9BC|nr:uncharacterized protein N7471_010473 [Penicillium samsonianum]KAJ6125980.1 hypothetical protein N7471_010473 [Penicillium samsonianum]